MATTVTYNGQSYSIPANREPRGWGTSLSNFLVSVANNSLSKAGGTFTLTADVDFGATYGLKVAYLKTRSSNPATAGIVRFSNNEGIGWRNAANGADKILKVNVSDRLEIDGANIVTPATTDTFTNKTIVVASNTITTAATGNLAATELNAALAELQGDIDTRATLTGSETLSNKTLTSPIINSPSLTTPSVDVMTLDGQASAPANPSSGFYKTYVADSDGKLHILDSSGNDVAVGSGSSGRNYLGDWFDAAKAESVGTSAATSTGNRTVAGNTDPTKWVTSDLTNLTFTRSADTTLRQSYNYLINSGDANADFVESPLFTLDGVDLGKPITVSFDCAGVSASDDYQVCAVRYDSGGTYQEVIVIAGTASATTPYSARIPTGTTKFQGFFIAGSTATDQYAIRFMKHAVNVDLRIDSLYVGPEKVVQGAAVTDWVSFTPTGSWSTNTTYVGKKRFLGDTAEYEVSIQLAGAPTSATLTVNMPTNEVIDTGKLVDISRGSLGELYIYDNAAGGAARLIGEVAYNNTTSVACYVIDDAAASTHYQVVINATTPKTFAANDRILLRWKAPIVGHSSNITMADRAVEEYYSVSDAWTSSGSAVQKGVSGGAITGALAGVVTKTMAVDPILPTDKVDLEFSSDRIAWQSAGMASLSGYPIIRQYSSGSVEASSAGYYVTVTSTSVAVTFFRYMAIANDDSPTVDWQNNTYWRVRITRGGAAVGYPISPANITKAIARYTTNAAQSIDNAGSGEVIDFEDKVFDTKNNVTTGASWKFTASEAGYYRVSATVLLNSGGGWAAAEAASISIRRSGTVYSRADAYQTASHTAYVTCHVDDVVYLENGQYVDILIYQNSGGAITLFNSNDYNFVSIEQVM